MIIVYSELVLLLIVSLVNDIKTQRINNKITYLFSAAGILTNCVLFGVKGFILSIAGWIIPFLLLFILYALKMIGAGDIKLFSAIGAIEGTTFAVYSIAFSFVFGGLMGVLIMSTRKNMKVRFKKLLNYIKACLLSVKLLPYDDFKKEDSGHFPFACAAVPGALVQLTLILSGIKMF
jgi:prepilin peptidase CpaA